MRLLPLLALILTPLCATAQDRYVARFDDTLQSVQVSACFDGALPVRLYHSSEASRFTQYFRSDGKDLRLAINQGSTRLPRLTPGSCIEWRVDLARATRNDDFRLAMRVNGDLVSDADLWFFRGEGQRDVVVDVHVPDGYSVSAPWPSTGQSDNRFRFQPQNTPATWSARVAIGEFDIQVMEIDGASIRTAIIGSVNANTEKKLNTWLEGAARAVGNVYGQYPQASPQILVVPIGRRSEAVPWAHVTRGGGTGAEFFVDETRPLEEFEQDWTACHELSHMLLPFVSSRDRWLSEGLASYYQYVLLARSGMISEQQAWQGLYEGFGRGIRDTRRQSLADATVQGSYPTMRIYWSGAAMMLLADSRLRAASDNEQTLDAALAELQTCCMNSNRRWRARELFRQLDRITGTSIFTDLYEEHVPAESFPDTNGLWQSMGLTVVRDRVVVTEPAPLSHVRKSIMGQ